MIQVNLVPVERTITQAISFLVMKINGEDHQFWFLQDGSTLLDLRPLQDWFKVTKQLDCELVLSGHYTLGHEPDVVHTAELLAPDAWCLVPATDTVPRGEDLTLDIECRVRANPTHVSTISIPNYCYMGTDLYPRRNPFADINLNALFYGRSVHTQTGTSEYIPTVPNAAASVAIVPQVFLDRHSPEFSIVEVDVLSTDSWPASHSGYPGISVSIDTSDSDGYVYFVAPVPWGERNTITTVGDIPLPRKDYPRGHLRSAFIRLLPNESDDPIALNAYAYHDAEELNKPLDLVPVQVDRMALSPSVLGSKYILQFYAEPPADTTKYALAIGRQAV